MNEQDFRKSFNADVGGVTTIARLADEALVAEALENDRDRHDADVWASPQYLALRDRTLRRCDDVTDAIRLARVFVNESVEPQGELFVRLQHRVEYVLHERPEVVRVLVPTPRTGAQSIVVVRTGLLDNLVHADIFAHNVTGAARQKERQKSAHASVAVLERMDAEEVEDEHDHEQQRIEPAQRRRLAVGIAEKVHRQRRVRRCDRSEQRGLASLAVHLRDCRILALPCAAGWQVREELLVQGKDGFGRRLHRTVVRQHGREALAIGADSQFVFVARLGILVKQIAETIIGRRDALDAVRRHNRLLPRNLDERVQHLVLRIEQKILPSFVFVYGSNEGHYLW